MDKKSKIVWTMVVVVVLVVAAGLYLANKNSMMSTPTQNDNGQANNNAANSGNNPVVTSENITGGTESVATLSYTDASRIYADKEIQFDSKCIILPPYFTIKNGTQIMIDNRSDVSKVIKLDNVPYTMKPYSFKIITLSTSAALPHTIAVDCGPGENSARILLQK